MLGVLATLKVQSGKEREFEQAFLEMREAVIKNEPGNKLYDIFRDPKNPGTYIVMEEYVDKEAQDAHGKSDHFKAGGAKVGACLSCGA